MISLPTVPVASPRSVTVDPPWLGVACPLPPGKGTAEALGVRDLDRELRLIETTAAELRRDRGGRSPPGEGKRGRGDPSFGIICGNICSTGVPSWGDRRAT